MIAGEGLLRVGTPSAARPLVPECQDRASAAVGAPCGQCRGPFDLDGPTGKTLEALVDDSPRILATSGLLFDSWARVAATTARLRSCSERPVTSGAPACADWAGLSRDWARRCADSGGLILQREKGFSPRENGGERWASRVAADERRDHVRASLIRVRASRSPAWARDASAWARLVGGGVTLFDGDGRLSVGAGRLRDDRGKLGGSRGSLVTGWASR